MVLCYCLMKEHIRMTIEDLQQKLTALEAEARDLKRLINRLCQQEGCEPLYSDDSVETESAWAIKPDEFYGQPLATCIRRYLQMRRNAGRGAATVSEIYDALTSGGFKFTSPSKELAQRALRISLSKNTSTFQKLPNGTFGLVEWYPAVRGAGTRAGDTREREVEGEPPELTSVRGAGAPGEAP